MKSNDVFRAVQNASVLIFATMVLGGCLSQGDSKESSGGGSGTPSGNAPPTISGSPAQAVVIGNMYSFIPKASDPDGDTLDFSIENQPQWLNFKFDTGELSGKPALSDVGQYTNIRISVSDGTDSASLPSFSISVDENGNLTTTLTWTAPTANDDGSTLTDLAGYKIYWGTKPGVYTNSVTLNNPGLTSYVVDNLSPGTYEFVATSINSTGTESIYSNRATVVLN